MNEMFNQIEALLEQLATKYMTAIERHSDPLKAAAIKQEILDNVSLELNQNTNAKSLFLYANQHGETLKLQLRQGEKNVQAKVDILERALRVKSVDYLKELVPFNTNIAQHALFSANPKNTVTKNGLTVEGVRSVHINSKSGEVLTTYDARIMGAIQSLWFKQNGNSSTVELKYADILAELGLSDGATNYKRIQESLIRLKDIEVTLTQFQRAKNAEYEEIALTRLIDQIVFRRKLNTTDIYQRKFEIRLPEWLVEANKDGNFFDVSLILMNDLKSYLAQGLYWLISSYSEEHMVKFELVTLASHFHFMDDGQPVMPVFKIVERITQACEELKQVGFIDSYEYEGKKQGLAERFLIVVKNPVFAPPRDQGQGHPIKQLEMWEE